MTAIADRPKTPDEPSKGFRPSGITGWTSWLTTTDHKKIGIMYFFATAVFFVVGGLAALAVRAQLAGPDGQLLTADQFNQIFTMHGVTMVFFVLMPMGVGIFGNYLIPLMIGARDVAFPRLNALSFWIFLAAGIFIYSSTLVSGMPDGGWTGYATLHSVGPDPAGTAGLGDAILQQRMLFYSIGLQIAGLSSIATSVNFIVTILNMRAPGMTLMRMPVVVWMLMVTAFMTLFAMPIISVAMFQLMFDVGWGATFFSAAAGGDPIMWQHLFWLFGHPEVYIMIMPSFGIVSEIIPTFSRKPIFGYAAMVFSGIAIGFMGFGVWAHHMFTAGMGPVANTAFGITSMFIAVPTGIKIFNWVGTMWGGQLRLITPMLFVTGMVSMFTIGGLSGVTHALVPHNQQQHDTYYIVAHIHYVLFGGALLVMFGGIYYWFPKVTGKFLNERMGKTHFWLTFIGFNLTFGPQHLLGLNGMPRRIYTYSEGMGWDFWNMVSTIGAFIIAVAVLVFFVNIAASLRGPANAGDDPWDARTLEWTTSSPPPAHNFDKVPQVTAREELWHRKYAGQPGGAPHRVAEGGSADHQEQIQRDTENTAPVDADEEIHMPDPSFWPLVLAASLPIVGWGVVFGATVVIVAGFAILLFAMLGWALEPVSEDPH